MKVAFRTDASIDIGTGHVMRCLTLANELSENGAECTFICRPHAGHLIDFIVQQGHQTVMLPECNTNTTFRTSDPSHATWLSTDWTTDAADTQRALSHGTVDWLIVDHYAIDSRWEQALRQNAQCLMVIDDLADRPHDCDLLLDQNYGSSAERYEDLVPENCIQMYGPDYALIKPAYADRRKSLKPRTGTVHRVLINFGGGSDAEDLSSMALQVFSAPELSNIELDIVIGTVYAHKPVLQAAAIQRGRCTIHTKLPNLAELMATADLAIGAGGATTWERCCMGLPSLVISIADNQSPACEALANVGLIRYLGEASGITFNQIREQVFTLMKQPETLRSFSAAGMALVEGQGASKVVHAIATRHRDDSMNSQPKER